MSRTVTEPRGATDMQLEPAQTLEIERLEPIHPFPADEARPGVKMRVQQRRPARRVRLLHEQLDRRARRRLDGEVRPADDLSLQFERQCRRPGPVKLNLPDAGSDFFRDCCGLGLEGIRRHALKVLLRRAQPLDEELFGQLFHRDERLAQQRHTARS